VRNYSNHLLSLLRRRVDDRRKVLIEEGVCALGQRLLRLDVHEADVVLVHLPVVLFASDMAIGWALVELLALVEAKVLLHQERQLYDIRHCSWRPIVGHGRELSFTDQPSRLYSTLQMGGENVREGPA